MKALACKTGEHTALLKEDSQEPNGAIVLVHTHSIVIWPFRTVLGWARREHEWHRHRSAFTFYILGWHTTA